MIKNTKIKGCYIISYKKKIDNRGHFLRLFDFKKIKIKQISLSFNKSKYTFRGFHFQKGKYSENKYIYCSQGELIDFVIDIRKNSKTYLNIMKINLKENDSKLIFIPKGCLHGFYTLKNKTSLIYFIDQKYKKSHSSGYNYKSKKFNMKIFPKIISKRDKLLPDF